MKSSLVLGIDAAWTSTHPSGIALVQGQGNSWKLIAACSSYESFLGFKDNGVDRLAFGSEGSEADPNALLKHCISISGGLSVDVVAVDMPLRKAPIEQRREADDQVSRIYGSRGCSVHSPTSIRPGKISDEMTKRFAKEGLSLAVTEGETKLPALIEVYPHVALLSLMELKMRHPYKVSKSKSYWKNHEPEGRFELISQNIQKAWSALRNEITLPPLSIPTNPKVLSHLKAYEDLLDAVVCAWMGIKYLAGETEPLGDDKAAIWVPQRLE